MIKTILPAIALSVLLTGCGSEPTAAPDAMAEAPVAPSEAKVENADETGGFSVPGMSVKNDKDKSEVTVGTTKTESAKEGKSLELPADLPADVPMYPGTRVTGNMSDSKRKTTMLLMKADGSMAQVTDYYARELKQQGWKVVGPTEFGKKRRSVRGNKGNRQCMVDINEGAEGGSNLMLTVMEIPAN